MFTVDADEVDHMLERGAADAAFMKRPTGFVSTQLHRGIGASTTFMNYAVWQSVADFRRAFAHPDFPRQIAAYPASAVSRPHLFRKVAVPGICVAR